MTTPDFTPIRELLQRLFEASAAEAERGPLLREVRAWLQARGLDVVEEEPGALYVGRFDDPVRRRGEFHYACEVLPDGGLDPFEELEDLAEDTEPEKPGRMPTALRQERRAFLRDAVDDARDQPREVASLKSLLARMDDPGFMPSEELQDHWEVFEPVLLRYRQLGGDAIVATLQEWRPESGATEFLVRELWHWAGNRPAWKPDLRLAEFLRAFAVANVEDDARTGPCVALVARLGPEADDLLRSAVLRPEAPWTDVRFGTEVLAAREDPEALELLREAFAAWRQRGNLDMAANVADAFRERGTLEDVPGLVELVKTGMEEGQEMDLAWEVVLEVRERARPSPLVDALEGAGVDARVFRNVLIYCHEEADGAMLHLGTGRLGLIRPRFSPEAAVLGDADEGAWWTVPVVPQAEQRDFVLRWAAGLPSAEMRERLEQAAQGSLVTRFSGVLAGHPDLWMALDQVRMDFQREAFERVAAQALEAMAAYRGGETAAPTPATVAATPARAPRGQQE